MDSQWKRNQGPGGGEEQSLFWKTLMEVRGPLNRCEPPVSHRNWPRCHLGWPFSSCSSQFTKHFTSTVTYLALAWSRWAFWAANPPVRHLPPSSSFFCLVFCVVMSFFFLIQGTKSENVMEVAGSFHVLMRNTANWPVRPHDLHRGCHWLYWMELSEHSVSAVYPLKQSDFLLTELDSGITYCKGRRQLIKFVSGLPPGNLFSPGWFLSGPWHVLIGMTLLADAEGRQTPAGSQLLKCSTWHFL